MSDTRECLKKKTILRLDKEYEVQEVIGRGASCLVYDGFYTDSSDGVHRVRIKECFPCDILAERDSQGWIVPAESWKESFERAKGIFSDAYIRNTKIRNTMGLTNATVDARWIQRENNTIYSVMSYIEGTDYGKYKERFLKDIFTRMKKLCEIIGGYHREGCLHLDIKPENILIPSDTKEQVVLFDFDSLTELQSLREGEEVRLSCSEGFSAPELVQGDRRRICAATDIYSLGAVVFYKIFGRTPEVRDRRWDAKYDFSVFGFPDERYQPKLFTKLTEFFHKTIVASVPLRYQDMKDAIGALEELENLSDVEGIMLLDHFSYHFSQFVGREDEMLQIGKALEEQDVVFLSGMGGIGKTELAKYFANRYRERFNRIVFLKFADSILETVCSEELVITNCALEEQESVSGFYKRKMAALKKNVGKDDLIILDNFDRKNQGHAIEEDEHFNDLFHCGCKLLVTTREDFWREYSYAQVEIGSLGNDWECRALFQRNNHKEYSENEWDSIEELFELFENHTMSIALFAKYLLHTEETPSELLHQVRQKEGTAGAVNPPVRHNKDDMPKQRKLYIHLEMLFDLSGFTELETEIMRSLSLLGSVRMKKSMFVQFFKSYGGIEEYLDNLMEHGWIEYDAETDKISLHQIILDLAYNSLKPTSENCPNIIRSMISYFQKKEENRVDRENRKRLAEYFIERMEGSDLLLAELYYQYCQEINYEEEILKRVQQICKEADSYEGDILLVKSYQLEIKFLIHAIDWMKLEDDEQMEETLNHVYGKVFALEKDIFAGLRNAILRKGEISKNACSIVLPEITGGEQRQASDAQQLIQEIKETKKIYEKVIQANFENFIEAGYPLAPYVDDDLVRLFLETADTVETLGNRICEENLLMEVPAFCGMANIYHDAEQIYLYTCKLAEQDCISYVIKEDLYRKIEEFYSEDDMFHAFRSACVGDENKRAYYSEKRTDVSGENSCLLNEEIISCMDAARKARWDGRYEDAIALCKKAMERKEGYIADLQCEIPCEMSRSYIELKEYEKAETLFLASLKGAAENDLYDVFEGMVNLYETWGNGKNVVKYCEQIIQNQKKLAEQGNITAITRTLIFGIKKAKWEGGGEIRLKEKEYLMWNEYFRIINKCNDYGFDSMLVDAYCEYAKYCWEAGQPEEALELIFSAAEKFRKGLYQNSETRELYECILREERFWQVRRDLYVRAALGDAENYLEAGDEREAAHLCRYAEELLKKGIPDSQYIEALLRKVEADRYLHFGCRPDDDNEYKRRVKQCNYYLITERKIEEEDSQRGALDAWKEAVDDSLLVDNYDMAKRCLERMEQEAERDGRLSGFQTYYSQCFRLDREEGNEERLAFHTKALYGRLIQYLQRDTDTVDDALCQEILRTIRENAFEYGDYDVALYVGFLNVSYLLDEQWMGRMQVREDLPEDEMLLKYYINRAEMFFPDKIDKDKLDEVISLMDEMLAGIEGNMEFKEFHETLSGVAKRYRSEQVEFK